MSEGISTDLKEISDIERNELTIQQQNQILSEIASSQPLIGLLISPTVLIDEYQNADSNGFIPGLKYLASKYLIRKVRGDGNCFYRSLLFAYLEKILTEYNSVDNESQKQRAELEHNRMINKIKSSKDYLISIGYSEVAFECFFDVIYNISYQTEQQMK
jgi:ubiquitin thioesterase protein OTUB1